MIDTLEAVRAGDPAAGRHDENRLLSIVVPLYNEESGVGTLFDRVTAVLDRLDIRSEVILVDDGSRDRTAALVNERAEKDQRIKLVRLSRNFGHQAAISAGMDHASGDALVVMDGDLQDAPEEIPAFLEKWREGYDVVYAIRRSRTEGWHKRAEVGS